MATETEIKFEFPEPESGLATEATTQLEYPMPEKAKYDKEVLDSMPDNIKAVATDWYVNSAMGELAGKMEEAGIYSREPSDIAPGAAAFAAGMSHMMTDIARGIKQMIGMDEEKLKADQAIMNNLYEDEDLGAYAFAGAITGALAEPVGFLIPGGKAKTLAGAAAKGAAVGGGFGFFGYVDEEKDQSRIGNAAIGATAGGILNTGIQGWKVRRTRKATKFLQDVEHKWDQGMAAGRAPEELTKQLQEEIPKLSAKLKDAAAATEGRTLRLSATKDEAIAGLQGQELYKPNDLAAFGDTVGGIVSTRVGNHSQAVKGRLREYDHGVMQRTHDSLKEADGFLQSISKIKGETKGQLDRALDNGDFDIVESLLTKQGGDALNEWQKVRNMLDEFGDELVDADRIKEKLTNYFPRYVKDVDGLVDRLGHKHGSLIEKALAKAATKKGDDLTPFEQAEVIDKVMRGWKPEAYKPGLAKARTIHRVDEHLQEFYAPPEEALHTYIRNAVTDLEKLKFFGKSKVYKEVNGQKFVDIEGSVGGVLQKEMDKGLLDANQQKELQELLSLRFGIGEKSPRAVVAGTKNIMYMGLLANPVSAATQLGDLGVAMYINGFRNTSKALVQKLTGRLEIGAEDMGLMDNMAEEFATTGMTAKWLRNAFKYSGFKTIDKLGKDTIIQGSLNKFRRLSNTQQGRGQISKKYRDVFGDQYGQLVDDLQNKRMTDNVKLLLFNEIADVQPVSLSEVPEAYLRAPNGRIAYMLKTFMLKQMDVLRRESYNEIKKGNVAKGLANLMRYGIIIGSTNAGSQYVKDWMLGRDVEPEATDIGTNFFKTFGWSEYTANKALGKDGRDPEPFKAVGNVLMPPFLMFDTIFSEDKDWVKHVPIAGRMIHNWLLGGLEEYEQKERQKELKERADRRPDRPKRPNNIR